MSNSDQEPQQQQGKKLPQYIAALSVCLGSVAAGTVLGFTGNISKESLSTLNDFEVDETAYGWVSSFVNIGAMLMCFPIGFVCDLIGRKLAMLLTIIPFTLGWFLIIFAQNVPMIYAGRFFTGLAGGSFCVSAPMYTSEIAEKEVRGALGSYFQLLLTVGILFVYVLGATISPQNTAIVCACVPIVFGLVFFFQPETPIYLLKKGKVEEATKSLRRLRGDGYKVEVEIEEIQESMRQAAQINISFMESFKKRATKRALLICFGLMFFQQLGGINAVIFYSGDIFDKANTSLSSTDAAILVGAMQVGATFVASLVIDKLGRKILLLFSDIMMVVSGIVLAVYFNLQSSRDSVDDISFLPILGLSVFIIVFSLGFGPIPWMIASEVLPAEIKSNASSAAGTFNWFLAFIVTKFYQDLVKATDQATTFYIFAAISICGTFFVYFMVPETKGKTLDEIQRILNGEQKPAEGIDNKAYKE